MPQRSEFDRSSTIEIDAHADHKQDMAIRDNAIRIDNIHMASRSVMADYKGLSGWITLCVKDRNELAVEKSLLDADIVTFVPCEEGRVEVRRGRKWTIPRTPVLSGYVQVRCAIDPRAISGLLSLKSVIGIVGGALRPWRTDDRDMKKFMAMFDNGAVLKMVADRSMQRGDEVRVLFGPWTGMHGHIVQMPDREKSGKRLLDVVVALSLDGQRANCCMPLAFVRKL